jgi:hypothetical protein
VSIEETAIARMTLDDLIRTSSHRATAAYVDEAKAIQVLRETLVTTGVSTAVLEQCRFDRMSRGIEALGAEYARDCLLDQAEATFGGTP